MLKFLELRVKAPITTKVEKKSFREGSYYRDKVTIAKEKLIVILSNGSLSLQSERPLIRNNVIARRLGVKVPTVSTVLRRWRMSGLGEAYFDRVKNKRWSRISPDIVIAIVQQKLVDEMAYMSLPERLPIIREKFSLPKLARSTLRKIYREHGIRYRRPRYQYLAKYL